MKIRYKHQRFQAEAAKCVSDVFQGQPKHDGSRTFLNKFGALNFDGFGNFPLVLDNESICENVRGIQMAEGLNPVEHLEGDGRTFTIEMETGTGKTYTYIKTMYELNARYGWSKFVIVVPSIAIREGARKSIWRTPPRKRKKWRFTVWRRSWATTSKPPSGSLPKGGETRNN